MKRIHLIIKGHVQGVFFRKFIKDNADKLRINGWVKNEKDYVEAVLEGKSKAIEEMLKLCNKGPKGAIISIINFKEEPLKKENSFKIIK